MAEFTFGQVEAILAGLHDIADHKRSAFGGRLKNLQSNGIPNRKRSGRGRAGAYSFSQLMQLAVGIELMQAGVQPQPAAEVVAENWTRMRPAILFGVSNLDGHFENYFWLIQIAAFGDMQITSAGKRHTFNEYHVDGSDNDDALYMLGNQLMERRGSVGICGSTIAREIALRCIHFADASELSAEIAAEIKDFNAALKDLASLHRAGPQVLSSEEARVTLARDIKVLTDRIISVHGHTKASAINLDKIKSSLSSEAISILLSDINNMGTVKPELISELLAVGLLSTDGKSFLISETGRKVAQLCRLG